jgi:VWFA-related protein
MRSALCLLLFSFAPSLLPAFQEEVVFRSDVALVRVDVQVLDRDRRAITGLRMQDFELREQGRPLQIRNFASEEMPVDILLLLDVSGSMRPHVERLANAAHEALRELGEGDRVGIMVFDTMTRIRLPLKSNRDEVHREFQNLLRREGFNGGTDINRGLLDAAQYMSRNGRKEARRAIVILTDDQTQGRSDEYRIVRALASSDTVLCAILAPDAMGRYSGGYPGGRYPGRQGGVILGPPVGGWPGGGGGGWPGGGGGYPGGGYPGGGYPGGGYPGGRTSGPPVMGGGTHSAGTAQIARDSGGDSMNIDDTYAFQNTLSRIRQRYALHFLEPAGSKAGEERRIEVLLSPAALRRYPNADLRFRSIYYASGNGSAPVDGPVVSSTTEEGPAPAARSTAAGASRESGPPIMRRRPLSDGSNSGPRGPSPIVGVEAPKTSETPATPPAKTADTPAEPGKGWRKLKPGETP